jgi:hypothetical protein
MFLRLLAEFRILSKAWRRRDIEACFWLHDQSTSKVRTGHIALVELRECSRPEQPRIFSQTQHEDSYAPPTAQGCLSTCSVFLPCHSHALTVVQTTPAPAVISCVTRYHKHTSSTVPPRQISTNHTNRRSGHNTSNYHCGLATTRISHGGEILPVNLPCQAIPW